MYFVPILCGMCALIVGARLLSFHFSSWRRHLPPGPQRRFLVGNAFEWPMEYPWKTWADWGSTYGTLSLHSSP